MIGFPSHEFVTAQLALHPPRPGILHFILNIVTQDQVGGYGIAIIERIKPHFLST